MKKSVSIILVMLLLTALLPVNAFAAEAPLDADNIIYYEDGSYITIEIDYTETRATSIRVGSKTYTYYNADNEELWRARLSATFQYDKVNPAVCTSCDCEITITDTTWQIDTNEATKSGNTATAEVRMVKKFLGITINSQDVELTLSCSPTGDFT